MICPFLVFIFKVYFCFNSRKLQ